MKKLLLLLAGLLFAVLPSKAQDKIAEITSTVVTNIEDLTTGYYVINCYIPRTQGDVEQNSPEKPWGSLYYNPNRLDRPFDVTSDGFIFEGQSQVSSEQAAYIWFVSKDESGILKIQNVKKDVYIPVDPEMNKNMNMTSAKATATLKGSNKTYTDILERTMSGIVLQYTEESVTGGPWTIYANYASPQDPNLSYWTSGDGEVMFQFVKLQNIDFSFKYPFKTSIAPTAEGFHPETRWQLLTIKNQYLYYTNDNTNIRVQEPIFYDDKYWWAFSINEDGSFTIYNKAAGPTKVLAAGAMSGNNGGSTFPRFVASDNIPEGQIAKWNFLESTYYTDKKGFYIYRGNAKNEKMNLRGDLAFWTGGQDGGSTFWISTANTAALKVKVKEQQDARTGYIGVMINDGSNSEYSEFIDKLNNATTPEDIQDAINYAGNAQNVYTFDPDKFYRLQNVMRGGVLQINTQSGANYKKLTQSTMNKTNANMLWKVETIDGIENGVKLYHVNAGEYAGNPGNTTLNKTGAEYIKVDWKLGNYGFKQNGTNNYLVQFSGGNIASWSEGGKGTDHAWYIMPAEDIELNISAAGYATVNYPFAVQLPEELTAYTGTANAEKSKFILEEVPDGAVPANTPVVIEGGEGTHTLTIDYENTNDRIESDLSGSLLPIAISADDYILAKDANEVVGFYKTTDGGTLAQNKAYIESTPAIQAVRGFGFSTEGDGTTGIENTVTETENEEYYDLQGRRVLNPTKGIYVTKSGKKVLFIK